MNERIVELEFDQETKGTWRYKEIVEEGEKGLLKTVYLSKNILETRPSSNVRVIVQWED